MRSSNKLTKTVSGGQKVLFAPCFFRILYMSENSTKIVVLRKLPGRFYYA